MLEELRLPTYLGAGEAGLREHAGTRRHTQHTGTRMHACTWAHAQTGSRHCRHARAHRCMAHALNNPQSNTCTGRTCIGTHLIHSRTQGHTCVWAYVCTCTHTQAHTQAGPQVSTQVCTQTHTHIQPHKSTHRHVSVHTFTQTGVTYDPGAPTPLNSPHLTWILRVRERGGDGEPHCAPPTSTLRPKVSSFLGGKTL